LGSEVETASAKLKRGPSAEILTNFADVKSDRISWTAERRQQLEEMWNRGDSLGDLDVAHGIIAAVHPETPGPGQGASVATLVRRLDRVCDVDLLVVDEAHHAVAGTWSEIIEGAPGARILGCTATPERLDGKGLGDIFDSLIIGPSVSELIAAGYLALFTAYAPARDLDLSGIKTRVSEFAVDQLASVMSNTMVIGSTVEDYTRLCPGAPAILCVDIAHSKLVAARVAASYKATHVDGDTNKDERREPIRCAARMVARRLAETAAGAPAVCRCKECGALNPVSAITCKACGAPPRLPVPRVEVKTPTLVEINRLHAVSYGQVLQWAAGSEDRLPARCQNPRLQTRLGVLSVARVAAGGGSRMTAVELTGFTKADGPLTKRISLASNARRKATAGHP
jgi:hypothetical protein